MSDNSDNSAQKCTYVRCVINSVLKNVINTWIEENSRQAVHCILAALQWNSTNSSVLVVLNTSHFIPLFISVNSLALR